MGSSPTSSATAIMFNFLKTCLPAGRKQKEPESLKEVLASLQKLEEKYEDVLREVEELKKESRKSLKKIGLIRFNPFNEIGGDQSFSVALLDEDNNGFAITSHYGREGNRVYAKPIEQGKSKYQLSKEEAEAISRAIGS